MNEVGLQLQVMVTVEVYQSIKPGLTNVSSNKETLFINKEQSYCHRRPPSTEAVGKHESDDILCLRDDVIISFRYSFDVHQDISLQQGPD